MIETKFKQTEIGPIPEDWEVSSLSDVGEIKMCKRILKFQTSDKGDIPFYKIGTFGKVADAYISRELYEEYLQKYNYPKKGDILLSAAGTIGRTVVFDGKPSYFQDSNIVWINNDESLILNSLLYYIYDRVSWVTESGTIPRIYNGIVHSIKFAHPTSLVEQEKIAKALSDVDALINDLGELIVKKRNIKQGTMQQLLAGKKRLPGFTGKWNCNAMWELTAWDKFFSEVEKGKQKKVIRYPYLLAANMEAMEQANGNVYLLATGNYEGWTTEEIAGNHLCEGEVVSIPWGGYANIKYTKGKFVTADNRIATSLDTSILDNKYLYYYMLQNKKTFDSFYRGAGIQHPSMADVLDFEILYPSIDEQRAIATILTDMDDEIQDLEAKRDKYTAIKQGMMQELLTGKIRLV